MIQRPYISDGSQVADRALGSHHLATLDGKITPMMVFLKAGAPTDADFANPVSGLIVLDTTNERIYFRSGSTWKYAALT